MRNPRAAGVLSQLTIRNVFILLSFVAAGPALAVPEGFQIHEFAGPSNADYPAALTAAANGDLYVSSDLNGSLGHNKDFGRIVRCRDSDGDGVADETKQLLSGLGGGIEHPRGADHTRNGVRMGTDGWLYVSVGDFGTTPAKGTDRSS